jgi:hypothetical protein
MYFNQGVSVSFGWIPSHMGIHGNEVVDGLAKAALSHDSIKFNVVPGFKDLFSEVERIMLGQWQKRWSAEVKGRFFYKLEPQVSCKVMYTEKCRSKQTALTRLRFGRCLLNDTLSLLKKRDDSNCDFCFIREDVQHFLLDCLDFQVFQDKLIKAVLDRKMVVSLETLLKNQCFFDLVWEYVQATHKQL